MDKPITDTQTPDAYNAENGEKMEWREAVKKGYVENESTENSSNTGSE